MIVMKGGRLIDGTGATPANGATIVVEANRVETVTTRSESDFPADAKIIDISGMTILPGLIDTPPNREAMPDADFSRWVTPESLAEVILFLVADASRDISGAAIPVFGKS